MKTICQREYLLNLNDQQITRNDSYVYNPLQKYTFDSPIAPAITTSVAVTAPAAVTAPPAIVTLTPIAVTAAVPEPEISTSKRKPTK